jgi:hypothetical protein
MPDGIFAAMNLLFMLPYLLGVTFVGLVLILQSLFKRASTNRSPLQGNNILAAYLGLMSSLCGITLAFLLSAAWNNHEQTSEITNQEALTLGSIAFYGRGLPRPFNDEVVAQVRQYAQTVIDDEWPSLAKGQYSPRLNQESARLGILILRYQPTNGRGEGVRQQLMEAFAELRVLRGERRLKAHYHIPVEIWVFIIFGALTILTSCILLEIEFQNFHLAQTGLIAAFLVLSLIIIWDLQSPFEGYSKVEPHSFLRLKDDMFINETAWQKLNSESR